MAGNNYSYYPYGQINTAYNPNGVIQNQYQQQGYQNNQMMQMNQNNNSGNLMTIAVSTEDEVNNYPVAAGMTVLLISFNLGKFWLKSTNTSGIPEPLRIFPFKEEKPNQVQPQQNAVTREEFSELAESVKKLINDLGGTNNG